MNVANFPNWRRRHQFALIVACWVLFSAYYYAKNQFEMPPLDILELLGSLPVFALAAHGTFFFLNRYFAKGKFAPGLMGLATWYAAVFLVAYLMVNLINPLLPQPFLAGERIPVTNRYFLNSTVTAIVNFSVLGFVFFLVYRVVSHANAMRVEAEEKLAALQRQAEAEAEKRRYEYLALADQVSPHFILNMLLFWEARVAKHERQVASSMQRLYGLLLYQARAREAGREVVPLSEEVAQMEAYLALVKSAHAGFCAEFDLDGDMSGYTIPPTTLLEFAENARKHGDTDAGHPVQIRLSIQDFAMTFSCRNRVKKAKARDSHGIGLANAKRRLSLQYGEGCQLATTEKDGFFMLELSIAY